MIVVQPEANIDTHMQLLGRVNRTGQVVLPEYDQLVLDIPAEKRPAAVLAKKMASLNANTTASRGQRGHRQGRAGLHQPVRRCGRGLLGARQSGDELQAGARSRSDESGKADKVDAMRKLTGRIPLLPAGEQQEGLPVA
jgi:hypothetical protein